MYQTVSKKATAVVYLKGTSYILPMLEKTPKRRFFVRRSVPVLTWRGWLVLLVVAGAIKLTLFLGIYPFLAVSSPVGGDLIVIEGWVPDHVITQAIVLFQKGGYRRIVATGVPIRHGYFLSEYRSTAEVAAATCRRLGVPPADVVSVPAFGEIDRDRTYASALALRNWIADSGLVVRGLDIVTVGPHARRSRLLFQRALGDSVRVGCIAVPDMEYDGATWWKKSAGVRDVLQEGIGYVYALILGP